MEWEKKLAEYQATPPPTAWNEIEETLLQDGNSLYHHAVSPPTDSWESISSKLSLTENNHAPRVFHWPRTALRYAAMIAFLALATTAMINNSFRNALIESIQGTGIKAALSDTQHILIKDSSKHKIMVKQLPR
jgi:hypothetical protein